MSESKKLPSYEAPPVIEVVCGVQFHPLELMQAHFGLLWQEYLPDYPECTEVPPLPVVIERFEGTDPVRVDLSEVSPVARTWFLHKNKTGIVQVQPSRFLHNWKKVRPTDEYPRYSTVIEMFGERFGTFEKFVAQKGLGEIRPFQYELTYVNHVPQGDGWETLADLHKVYPDFCFAPESKRFLPTFDSFNWRTAFALPEQSGRLHASMSSGSRGPDGKPILLLELTARGFPKDSSRDAMWSWFDLAHEWIVRGFADLTGSDIQQKQWRRQS